MKKIKRGTLLSTMLFASVLALSTCQGAHAALSASQTVSGTLALVQSVTTNGGTITSVIDPTTGNLNTTLNPGFTISTNSHASQAMTLKATLTDSTGPGINALFGNGTVDNIILANTAAGSIPLHTAITDIKSGSPTPANNANAIAYQVTTPANIGGQLTYTWNNGGQYWDATLTHSGNTNTAFVIPSGAAVANTYSTDDEVGTYQAIVTLSF